MRAAGLKVVVAAAALGAILAGCGGGGPSSTAAERHVPQYTWDRSSQEIKTLIAETEPYEVIPGCNLGQTKIDALSEVLEARQHGSTRSISAIENELKYEEEHGELELTGEEEEKICFEVQETDLRAEANAHREVQELEEQEAQREEQAREAARERTSEAAEAETAESPSEQEINEFWERTEKRNEEEGINPQTGEPTLTAKEHEEQFKREHNGEGENEFWANHGGDGP